MPSTALKRVEKSASAVRTAEIVPPNAAAAPAAVGKNKYMRSGKLWLAAFAVGCGMMSLWVFGAGGVLLRLPIDKKGKPCYSKST